MAEEEAKLSSTSVVFSLLDHVFVCLRIGALSLSSYSISSSLSLTAQRGIQYEGRERRKERTAVALGREREHVREGMR